VGARRPGYCHHLTHLLSGEDGGDVDTDTLLLLQLPDNGAVEVPSVSMTGIFTTTFGPHPLMRSACSRISLRSSQTTSSDTGLGATSSRMLVAHAT